MISTTVGDIIVFKLLFENSIQHYDMFKRKKKTTKTTTFRAKTFITNIISILLFLNEQRRSTEFERTTEEYARRDNNWHGGRPLYK